MTCCTTAALSCRCSPAPAPIAAIGWCRRRPPAGGRRWDSSCSGSAPRRRADRCRQALSPCSSQPASLERRSARNSRSLRLPITQGGNALSAKPDDLSIRAARPSDVGLILQFVRELAAYERLSHLVAATEPMLAEALFGPQPGAEVLLALENDTPAGFAVFFHNFSTFLGSRGLWLEDIYVKPQFRGRGYGRALLLHVACIAQERRSARFEWAALDWNTPAIEFYKALGAKTLDDWTIFRVTGEALTRLATTRA